MHPKLNLDPMHPKLNLDPMHPKVDTADALRMDMADFDTRLPVK